MDASATTQISRPAWRGISDLQKMSLEQLREAYEKAFGKPTKSRDRKQLFSRIAKKIQADRAGQKSEDAPVKPTLKVKFTPKRTAKAAGGKKKKAAAKKTTRTRAIGQRDPRLPKVGTTITREWHGKKYLVRVLDRGFEYDSKPFRSLSGVAKAISGQIVNGFAWFKLIPREGKKR